MNTNDGPSPRFKLVCTGCKWHALDMLRIPTHAVFASYCLHEEVAKKPHLVALTKTDAAYIGETSDMPEWCPFNPEG